MPGLLAQLPTPAQIQAISDGVTHQQETLETITDTLSNVPVQDIQALVERLNGLSLPNLTPVLDAIPSNLGELSQQLGRDPSALLGQLPHLLQQLSSTADSGLLAQLGPAVEQFSFFQDLSGRLAAIQELVNRFSPILQAISDPPSLGSRSPQELVQVVSELLEAAQPFGMIGGPTQVWVMGLVDTFKLWATGSPAELSEFVRARVAGLTAQVTQAGSGIPAAVAALQELPALLPTDSPATQLAPALADLRSLRDLDYTVAEQLQTARQTLLRIQSTLAGLATTLPGQLDQADARLEEAGLEVLQDELQRLVLALRAIAEQDVSGNPISQSIRAVTRWLIELENPDTLTFVQDSLAEVRQIAERLDLSPVQGPLLDAAEQIRRGVEEVERLQAEVAAGITGLFDDINQAIEQVDLATLQQRVEEVLQAFQQQVAPVQQQLQGLVNKLDQFMTQIESMPELDLRTLVNQLQALLTQLNTALTDPTVTGAIDSIRSSLEQMAQVLEEVSFDPVIESVIAEIRATTEKLRQIDPASLNDLVREALKAAVAVIKATNFDQEITRVLLDELANVERVALQAAEEATQKFDELTEGVRALDPERLLAEPLQDALDEAKRLVADVRPSRALQPALDELNALLDRLQELAPSRLLQPVVDFRQQVLDAVGSLSAEDLLRPLNEALQALRDALARISPETWFAALEQYAASVGSILKQVPLAGQLSEAARLDLEAVHLVLTLEPDRVEASLRGFLTRLLQAFDGIDLAIIRGAVAGLHAALDAINLQGLRAAVQAPLDAALQAVTALDLAGPLATLTAAWSQARAAVLAVTPSDAVRATYDEVVLLVEAVNPATVFAPAVTALDSLRTALTELRAGALAAVDDPAAIVAALAERLRVLYPRDLTLDQLKQSLIDALADMFVEPIREVVASLRAHATTLTAIIKEIQAIVIRLIRTLSFIVDPLALLQPIRDALRQLEEQATSFGLDVLEEQIDRTAGNVRDRLAAFDLAPLLAQLDSTFAEFIQSVRGLLSDTLVRDLDELFADKVTNVVQQLDADDLLAPLRQTFQTVRNALALVSAEVLFAPLVEVFERLLEELKDGLRRTGAEFGQMVRAIPV